MKKLLIFNAGRYIYGAEKGLINIVKALKDKFSITVVLPGRGPLEEKLADDHPEVDIKLFPLAVLYRSSSPVYYLKFPFLSVINVIYFAYYVRKNNIDTICTNTLILPFPGAVAWLTSRRHIWCAREFFPSERLNSVFGALACRFSDRVICYSEAIRKKLFLEGRAELAYDAIDKRDYDIYDQALARKELEIPPEAVVISIISRLHPQKGQLEFLENIKDILKRSGIISVVICGDISPGTLKNRLYKKRVADLVEKNDLKNVHILGFRKDVGKILSMSDICVFPFKREEPFGISVAEALAFGKTAFFPKSGGLLELRDIFKKGEDFSAEGVIKEAFKAVDEKKRETREFSVPAALSFKRYKKDINRIFDIL